MKRTLFAATALIVALTGSMASAQSYGHDRRDDRRDGYHQNYDRRDDRRDDRREYRDYRHDRRDDRREYRRWSRGDRLPYEYRRSYYMSDYGRYGYRAPPRGYGYYRTDTGDVVMAAIATGVIISILSH